MICYGPFIKWSNGMTKIRVKHLSKTFGRQGVTYAALKDVNFLIESGDIFGIIGPSGAGKSTLLRCLAGLLLPSEGAIFYNDGIDISLLNGEDLRNFRKSLGMVFQHFNLLTSRTVAGNISFALEIAQIPKVQREERVNELLELVGLVHKRDAYPALLSGGEKQRVGIARALANHPEVLFCDEATSALDPRTTREILHLLRELNRKLGITIILITHEMEVVKAICSKVAVIDRGEIIEQGDVADVFAEPKNPTTKNLLQHSAHEIPERFLKGLSPSRRLLRLSFKGDAAGQPVISQMIKTYGVDANILLGWLDHLQTAVIGTLVIELRGEPEQIRQAMGFLEQHCIGCEVVHP